MKNELELTVTTRRNIQSVSARELHEKLEIKSHFYDWFKRMCEYGFIENEDYKRVTQKKVTPGGEQETADYAVSVDMAKQICMLQRNAMGMQYRRYLLDIEKRWKEKQTVEYKQARQKSIEVRKTFTDTLKAHGYDKQYEYINTTKAMKKPFGITAKKTDMTEAEIKKITAAEYLAEAMLADECGYSEVNPVCVDASNAVYNAMQRRKLLSA